jgi:hypothetical protein
MCVRALYVSVSILYASHAQAATDELEVDSGEVVPFVTAVQAPSDTELGHQQGLFVVFTVELLILVVVYV